MSLRLNLAKGASIAAAILLVTGVVQAAEISNFDANEGLDLEGDFVYAINVGGSDDVDFGGLTWTPEFDTDGLEVFSTHEIRSNWAQPDLGDDDLDHIIETIIWSESPAAVEFDFDVTQGETYKLQMMFYEACCNRGFDIFLNDEEIVEDFAIHENHLDWDGVGNWGIQAGRQDGVLITHEFIAPSDTMSLILGGDRTADQYPDNNGHISAITLEADSGATALQPGDADQDLDFDQLDLVKVQIAAKYLSGQPATWGEGDWSGGPGGEPGNPPAGDGAFDQLDIIAALNADVYLKGPYAALTPGGTPGDGQTSLVYNAGTGELAVDSPSDKDLTSINITSAGSAFVGDQPPVLDGAFDNFAADNIFKATFGGSFGDITFGNVMPAGLSEADVAADLSAVGSLAGGGDLGEVDLVYIPEPSTLALALLALAAGHLVRRRK